MNPSEPSEERVERAARGIDPEAFADWINIHLEPRRATVRRLARAALLADRPALIEARIAGMREALSIIGSNRIRLDDAFQVNDRIAALQAELEKARADSVIAAIKQAEGK